MCHSVSYLLNTRAFSGVLQCVAVRCRVSQCAAVCCRVLQCVAMSQYLLNTHTFTHFPPRIDDNQIVPRIWYRQKNDD